MKTKIKLLVDAHVFDDHFQGSRSYLKGLYGALIKIADEIDFVFAAYDIENLKKEFGTHNNVTYERFLSKNKLLRLTIDFPRIILKHGINVSHYQYVVPFLKMCKEVVTTHDVLFLDYPEFFPKNYTVKRKALFKSSARRADLLLTVSDYAKKAIVKNFQIPESEIYVIPNGIDNSFWNAARGPYTPEEHKPYLLYVSRIEPRKNHILLVRAFTELKLHNKGYKLIFVGKKDIESQAFNDYVNSLDPDIKKSILFFETVSQQELISFYRNCALFVYPSLAEGFGIPPLEAAAVRAKVLCSNATAMADFDFFDNDFFNPTDKEELKLKIVHLLQNQDVERLARIQSHVQQHYNWDFIAKNYRLLLRNHF